MKAFNSTLILLALLISAAIAWQWFLLRPEQAKVSLTIGVCCLALLLFFPRLLFSAPLCMAIAAASFGGLGMIFGHQLTELMFPHTHHHIHLNQNAMSITAWISTGTYIHYLVMLLFCFSACLGIGVLQKSVWPANMYRWQCHLTASFFMLLGMYLFDLLGANLLGNTSNASLAHHLASLLGMAFATGSYFIWQQMRHPYDFTLGKENLI